VVAFDLEEIFGIEERLVSLVGIQVVLFRERAVDELL
jgi:hypothetical protein